MPPEGTATIAKNLQPTTRASTQPSCRSDPRGLGQSLFTDLLGSDSVSRVLPCRYVDEDQQ